jgi:hypothetical protein
MKDKCKDCAEFATDFCGPCNELDEQTTEDMASATTTADVSLPPTMMPKRLMRRRRDPKVHQMIMVDRRYNEAKHSTPVLRKRFRKYIEDPT